MNLQELTEQDMNSLLCKTLASALFKIMNNKLKILSNQTSGEKEDTTDIQSQLRVCREKVKHAEAELEECRKKLELVQQQFILLSSSSSTISSSLSSSSLLPFDIINIKKCAIWYISYTK